MVRKLGNTEHNTLDLPERSEPAAPSQGQTLYVDSNDGALKSIDSTGNVVILDGSSDTTTIDDFEDADIVEYSGDTGNFTVDSQLVETGSYALRTTTNWRQNIRSTSGLPNYPQKGQVFEWYTAVGSITGGWQRLYFQFGMQSTTGDNEYYVRHNIETNEIVILRSDAGSNATLNSAATGLSPSADTWIRNEITWDDGTLGGSDGDITYLIENTGTGNTASVTTNNTLYSSGGVGFGSDMDTTAYFDSASITNGN